MKKLLILLLLFLLIPNLALATVKVTDQHILFSYGLDELNVSQKRIGEGTIEAIVISGTDLSQLEINGEKKTPDENNQILLFPGTVATNGYDFWHIKGNNNGKDLGMYGYITEVGGDTWLERNSLMVDLIKVLLVGAILFAAIYLLIKRRCFKKE